MAEIKGSGGGAQDNPRAPVESPDNLVSIARARIVDLISEGEIAGLVDGLKSIYLGGTPVQDGSSLNFTGVTYDQRTGTQDQTYMHGFAQVESEITVGVELTVANPYVRNVTNLQVSALRVNFTVPRLSAQDETTGDLKGYRVDYAIDVASGVGGSFVQIKQSAFDGKTTGGYQRSERIDLLGQPAGGWRVRVRRLTAESSSSYIADQVNVTSVTEIIDAKFRYPNSALIGIEFDAKAFSGSIPTRAYDMKGRIIQVPVNYDPEARTYSGIWDGTFKLAYTNNPAWIFYDLVLNTRYGLGNLMQVERLDKWSLYQISQYCDVLVDDGKGGQEPRFVCNCYLQVRVDALKLLQDLASVFRGITYWAAGQAFVSADMPGDPVYTYTNANVLNGKFTYRGSKLSTRYSVALVSWHDPADMYKVKQAYVPNDDAIARYGVREMQMAAFGCTSEGQAIRAGRWALLTNLLETEVISFGVGLDGVQARPGQIIKVADSFRAGKRIGGRIRASTINTVTVDNIGDAAIGDELTCLVQSGASQTLIIDDIVGNVVTLNDNWASVPIPGSPFVYESAELAAQTFRITGIGESGPLEYTISAVTHAPTKYTAIDDGIIVNSRPISAIPISRQAPPTNVVASTDYKIDQYAAVTTLNIAWDAAENASVYDVEWRRDNNNWVSAGRTSSTEMHITGVFAGQYYCRVKAINSIGVMSIWATGGPFDLAGKTANLIAPVNLTTHSEVFAIRVDWQAPASALDMAYTEVWINSTNSDTGATALGLLAFPTLQYRHSGMAAAVTRWFKARFIDKSGNIGPWTPWVSGITSADANEILDYLTGQITATELGSALLSEIDLISAPATVSGSVNARIDVVNDAVDTLDAQVAALQSQVADLVSAPAWNNTQTWSTGDLVQSSGRLYRALQNVPTGIAITNTTYWEDLGAYTSLSGLVSALSVRMAAAETDIDDITGDISAISSELAVVDSRLDSAESGISANATAITNTQTQVTQINGQVVAQGSTISSLSARFRDDDGEGSLASALAQRQAVANYALEVRTRAAADEALVQVTETLDASIGDNTAAIANLQQTVADNAAATATQITTINSNVAANAAAIATESTTRANADSAMATQISNISASLTTETTNRQNADNTLQTNINSANAAINSEATARANADSALATQINSVSASLTTETTDRQNADNTLQTSINSANAAIASEQTARVSADNALATNISSVSASLTTETTNRQNADNTLQTNINSANAAIAAEQTARVSADNALATSISSVQANVDTEVGNRTAAINAEATARANADSAISTNLSTVSAQVGSNTAAISVNATAIATTNSGLNAMYTVKVGIDTNGRYYSAGMGIGIENTPAGMQSQVLFVADRFAILSSTSPGATPQSPFIVQSGQVIINTAVIGTATISFAKIADDLQSTNYVTGSTGWRIAKNGLAEFNNVAIRGDLQSFNFSTGVEGWRILSNGTAEFNGVIISRPNIVASGSLTIPATTQANSHFYNQDPSYSAMWARIDETIGQFSREYIHFDVDIPRSTFAPEGTLQSNGRGLTANAYVINSTYWWTGSPPSGGALYSTPATVEIVRVSKFAAGEDQSFIRLRLKVLGPTNLAASNISNVSITQINWALLAIA